MKSQNFILVLVTFLTVAFSAKAQDIAPFQANDLAAIPITPEILQKIISQPWYLHNRSYVEKGITDDYRYYDYGAYEFQIGGICQQPNLYGTWTLNRQKNLLVITSDFPEQARQSKHLLFGGYAVYRITEEELILGKVLTSSHDTKILYCFENAERNQQRKLAKQTKQRQEFEEWVKAKKIHDPDWNWEEAYPQYEPNELPEGMEVPKGLKKMTKADLFMRAIQPEAGYVYFLTREGKVRRLKAQQKQKN